MLTSLRQLFFAVLRHWYQLLGGAAVAVAGLVADSQEWRVPGWYWTAGAVFLLLWATVSAYHDLRVQCDAARDGLRDKVSHQRLADELTAKHRWATHNLLNTVALNGSAPSREWLGEVERWYEEVLEVMRRHECTAQEFNHVETINQMDMHRISYVTEISMFIIRLDRVAEVSTTHAEAARAPSATAGRGGNAERSGSR